MNISELLSDLVVHYNAIVRHVASSLGLTKSQALHLISIPHDGISMSRLSHRLGLDASTLTRNIQKLEKMGLVERSSGSYDKRVQNIFLSHQGKEIVEKIEDILLYKNQTIMEQISLEGQEHVSDVLEKLIWAMDCAKEE